MSNDTAPATETQHRPCPPWCERTHLVPVHKAAVASLEVDADDIHIDVERDDRDGQDARTVVVLTLMLNGGRIAIADLPPSAARQLARRLMEAADIAAEVWPPLGVVAAPWPALADEPAQPRTWRWENEADRVEPDGVDKVDDDEGDRWWRTDIGLWRLSEAFPASEQARFGMPWAEVLETYGPLREVVPPAQGGAQ